ncbi:AAA-type ATPase N-terminal domain [Arabidopsis suecica]|uniref:AAA-type ATPase N-terminal domain n=1 Tax=Arabidopsis suecica TaxID=45249 RepID=A0A8T1YR59_ARASU|nr:AAA-type ATPase N-terminal domain [Arabidopsis suecica]
MMMMGDSFGSIGSSMASLFFLWATIQQIFPDHLKITIKEFLLSSFQQLGFAQRVSDHFTNLFSPYVEIHFPESDEFSFNQAFSAIETYLDSKSTDKSKHLRGSQVKESKGLVLKRNEAKVRDEYQGANVWWEIVVDKDGNRYYKLTFHNRARSLITNSYIKYVVEEGKSIIVKNKQTRLFTNNLSTQWVFGQNMWRSIEFEHPASFETLAMDPKKKEEIVNDLIAFSDGKEYYKKIGKAWKRGYLLYGPPGTGKSTMISAMANLLNYNIYDLELTAVKNNSELKKLLTATSSKSIIVIEDIDCSADFTSNRIKKENNLMKKNGEEGKDETSVTLSGLLNFIDGIWSACGQERIVVFTTNHLEKLDPALIRRGRMDMHIELSYCTYEAFKILAKNYLDLDGDDAHPLFSEIKALLEETMISPADVAENLMARNQIIDVDKSLNLLISVLEEENQYQRSQQEKKKSKKFKIFG